jgi:hypothetical protein
MSQHSSKDRIDRRVAGLTIMQITFIAAIPSTGCSSMPSTKEIPFSGHNFSFVQYQISNLKIKYGPRILFDTQSLSDERRNLIRPPRPDRERPPIPHMLGYKAFEGKLEVSWKDKSGNPLSEVIDLDQLFPKKVVRHNEDIKRIDPGMPVLSIQPSFHLDIEDRALKLFMVSDIVLRDPETLKREKVSQNVIPVFSKTY